MSSVVTHYFAQGYKVQLHYMLYLYLVLKRNQRSPLKHSFSDKIFIKTQILLLSTLKYN